MGRQSQCAVNRTRARLSDGCRRGSWHTSLSEDVARANRWRHPRCSGISTDMKSAKMITLTLLLAVLIAGGAWLYTPDKSRPVLEAKYLSASDGYRLVARIRLRMRESGRQDAPVVILLHGFGASLETWEA